MEEKLYDVIIIGSGPAGLTAAIYTTRANLKTLIIAGYKWGGQLMLTTKVENFPGFPDGIQGPDLMMAMRKQAEGHGAEILEADYQKGNFSVRPFEVEADNKKYHAKSVIIASGADARWLDVPGEKERIGRGVSSCATCDAPFFRNKHVVIVGGGDSAMEEALVLAKVATSVKIIHRRDMFRASSVMQKRAEEHPKIEFLFNTEVKEIMGEGKVERIKLLNNKTNEVSEIPVDGLFVAIGHVPNTLAFEGIDLDENGYVRVYNHTETNIPGVFVAGDVHDRKYRQAITAAGFGCAAALETEHWFAQQEK